jgi:hypothetical protein
MMPVLLVILNFVLMELRPVQWPVNGVLVFPAVIVKHLRIPVLPAITRYVLLKESGLASKMF